MKIFNLRKACVFLTAVLIEILIFAFINLATGLIFAFVALLAFIIYFGICYYKKKTLIKFSYPHRERLTALAVFCIGLIATLISINVNEVNIDKRVINQENVVITARVCANGNAYDNEGTISETRVVLDDIIIGGNKLDGKASIYLSEQEFKVGQRIKMTADIVNKERDFTSSYLMSAYNDKIYYQISSSNEIKIETVEHNAIKYDEKIKLGVKKILYSRTDENTSEFMFSLLFGNSGAMNNKTVKAFSATGISHIIAVSGLHIALLSGALIFILKKMKLNRWIVLVINSIFVILYSALCGFPPSVIRASCTITLILLAGCLGKRVDTLSIICLCASAILLVRIEMLFDLGYLLSFTAVFGLCILYKPLIKRKPKYLPKFVAESIASSLAVNISILPIIVFYFGKLNTVFILSNLIITPLISLLFPLFIPMLLLAVLISPTGVLLTGIGYIFSLLIAIITELAKIPFPTIYLVVNGLIIGYYVLTLLFLSGYSLVKKKGKNAILISFIVIMTINLFWTGVLNDNNTINVKTMQDYPTFYCYIGTQKAGVLYIDGEIEYQDVDMIKEFLDGNVVDVIMKKNMSKKEATILRYCRIEKCMLAAESFDDYHYDYFTRLGGEISYKDVVVNIDYLSVKSRDNTFDFSRQGGAKLQISYESRELLIGANTDDNKNYYPTDFTFLLRRGKIIG